jgi:hypothetical protein
MRNPKIGFIGWNPFQLLHVRKIIDQIPGALFILEQRQKNRKAFDGNPLWLDCPKMSCPQGKLDKLDGEFDVLVCQTTFEGIQNIEKSKIAMIQYGYAKEAHNYGVWRSFADLNLVYGDYAARKIAHFSPVCVSGNPRYDCWTDSLFHASAKSKYQNILDSSKETILYAPTWGDLCTIDFFLEAILNLKEKYNVIVKPHHNTILLEKDRMRRLGKARFVLGTDHDILELMAVADYVISDYSGAIFDAVFCRKPIVLLELPLVHQLGKKLDQYSLEYNRRAELGIKVDSPGDLVHALELSQDLLILNARELLHAELFSKTCSATQNAAVALLRLAQSTEQLEQSHFYVRQAVKELYRLKRKFKLFL